ncbi:HAD family hydrolase [Streptomyces aidingensis]|uniref:Phosphoglycolate phosphatase n=1 Tax=Streptomyces aidingensis TaxID=910347 RepID=A0A1I1HFI2_9ACTN|nr:haloacid dehalogenase-like hydrolase [Streptomyces aidingensis]SFC22767.1 phosphoglycolate phosphatase [Streptomyces aidingensis]
MQDREQRGPTVGFDLDMTLIDSRPGIRATYLALAAETGVRIDAELAAGRLGPPLEHELAHWFPAERVPAVGDRFRELYTEHAVAPTPAMPGAREAIDAVHRHGGRVLVVTAKYGPNARLHLDHLGLPVDHLVGRLWAEEKAKALRAHDAAVYVGDHVGDVRGAVLAGALSVTVPTGPIGAGELRAAGADVVLDGGLPEFPGWLDGWLAARAPR